MKQPLKIKDWLKERSEKPQFYVSHYYNGLANVVTRIRDKQNFSIGQIYCTTSEGVWIVQDFKLDNINVVIYNDKTEREVCVPIDNLYAP